MLTNPLAKYLVAGTILGAAYLLYKGVLQSKPNQPIRQLSLQETRKISQQIKYQVMLMCINFAESYYKNLKQHITSERDRKVVLERLRLNITKFYQQKQDIILHKFKINRDQYGVALQLYFADEIIKKNNESIVQMMERAIVGELPDLTVPNDALEHLSADAAKQLYRQISLKVAILVWKKMMEMINRDPNFDPRNDEHFKIAIRQLKIYDAKTLLLQQKGFKQEWGCPNEVFLKLLETHKAKSESYKNKMIAIESAYESVIEKVSHSPAQLDEQTIKTTFENKIQLNTHSFQNYPKPKLTEIARQYRKFTGQDNPLESTLINNPKIEQGSLPKYVPNSQIENSIF